MRGPNLSPTSATLDTTASSHTPTLSPTHTTSQGATVAAGARFDPALWRRAILIGTPATVAALAAQWSLRDGGPRPIGCLLTEPTNLTEVVDVPILGTVDALEALHRNGAGSANPAAPGFTLAVVSLPSSMATQALKLRALLGALGIAERVVPVLDDLLEGPRVTPQTQRREVDLVELIGRPPRAIDEAAVSSVLKGKRVLITGAGGSIGSELCRIAARFEPSQLVLMERAENALFEIDRAIAKSATGISRRAVLHDVVDADQTLRLFVALKPEVVFHAAAHKHVPLMEDHPSHAVTNNLFGTKSVADAAMAVGAERFVMISSDKAVNPTSVMGATKRLAEMYVQHLHQRSHALGSLITQGAGTTRFSMVRFGNVLGSACSVLPIWTTQIAEGGPVTVTDPRMTRYFMTITEAAQLVIQSAAIDPAREEATGAKNACVFVLDMGAPVKIVELAQRFIRLNGFMPRMGDEVRAAENHPIMDIAITGARPGEKLHEELAYAAEMLAPTRFDGIHAWQGQLPAGFEAAAMLAELAMLRGSPDKGAVVAAIKRHVPEMRPVDA